MIFLPGSSGGFGDRMRSRADADRALRNGFHLGKGEVELPLQALNGLRGHGGDELAAMPDRNRTHIPRLFGFGLRIQKIRNLLLGMKAGGASRTTAARVAAAIRSG